MASREGEMRSMSMDSRAWADSERREQGRGPSATAWRTSGRRGKNRGGGDEEEEMMEEDEEAETKKLKNEETEKYIITKRRRIAMARIVCVIIVVGLVFGISWLLGRGGFTIFGTKKGSKVSPAPGGGPAYQTLSKTGIVVSGEPNKGVELEASSCQLAAARSEQSGDMLITPLPSGGATSVGQPPGGPTSAFPPSGGAPPPRSQSPPPPWPQDPPPPPPTGSSLRGASPGSAKDSSSKAVKTTDYPATSQVGSALSTQIKEGGSQEASTTPAGEVSAEKGHTGGSDAQAKVLSQQQGPHYTWACRYSKVAAGFDASDGPYPFGTSVNEN